MSEFTTIRTSVLVLEDDEPISLDSDRRGGSSVTVKNCNEEEGNTIYVGPREVGGSALSSENGYPLAPGESWSIDFTFTTPSPSAAEDICVAGAADDCVACIFLMP